MAGITTKLNKLNKSWKDASKREPSQFEDLEPGVYLMSMTGATCDTFGVNQKLCIKWDYTVQEGESVGSIQSDFDQLETEDNLFWVQSKLNQLGYDLPDEIKELPEVLEDIEKSKPILRCKVVEKGGYTHVYINKVVEGEGGLTRAELLDEAPPASTKGKPDAKAEEAASGEIEVGSEVTHTDGSTGVVKVVKEDGSYEVEFEGEVYGCEASEVTLIVIEEETPAEEPEEPTNDSAEIVVGTKVSFEEEDQTFTGEVKALNDATESADVAVDGTDEVWDIEVSMLTVVPAASAPKKKASKKKASAKKKVMEVGSEVTYTPDGSTGKVTAIDGDSIDVEFEDAVYTVERAELKLN